MDISSGECIRTLRSHKAAVSSLLFHAPWLFSGSRDCSITQWGIDGEELGTFLGHLKHVGSLAMWRDALVSGSADATIKVWDVATKRVLKTQNGHSGFVTTLAVSGDLLWSGSEDNCLLLWNIESAAVLCAVDHHKHYVNAILVHDGTLFSCSHDRTIAMWNPEDGGSKGHLGSHAGTIRCICGHEGFVFTGGDDNLVRQWDVATKQCVHTLQGHTDNVRAALLPRPSAPARASEAHPPHACSGYLFSAGLDAMANQWDIESGVCLRTLRGHTDFISTLCSSQISLYSGGFDKTVREWHIDANDEPISAQEMKDIAAAIAASLQDVQAAKPRECLICMDQPRGSRLDPCGHYVLCAPCAEMLIASPDPKCPICRSDVSTMQPGTFDATWVPGSALPDVAPPPSSDWAYELPAPATDRHRSHNRHH
eukprot:gene264-2387_t